MVKIEEIVRGRIKVPVKKNIPGKPKPKTKRNPTGRGAIGWSDEEIIRALEKSEGDVKEACSILKCHPQTIYQRYAKSPKVKEAARMYRKVLVGVAKGQLRRAVKKGVLSAVFFTLKTLGRSEGFVERTETRHGGDKNAPPIQTENLDDQSRLAALIERAKQRKVTDTSGAKRSRKKPTPK